MNKLISKIISVMPKWVKNLYGKYESVILYVLVGGMTTVVSIAVQYASAWLGFSVVVNTTASWVCAVTFAFITNKLWVFKEKTNTKSAWFRQALAFYGARLNTYVLEVAFMHYTVEILAQNEFLMKLIAQVFIIVLNYLFSKFVVFKKRERR